jgi:hypothetical protein
MRLLPPAISSGNVKSKTVIGPPADVSTAVLAVAAVKAISMAHTTRVRIGI